MYLDDFWFLRNTTPTVYARVILNNNVKNIRKMLRGFWGLIKTRRVLVIVPWVKIRPK